MGRPRQFPSEKQDQYMLRLPDGMRDELKGHAERNRRSLNAEIIARLEATLRPPVEIINDGLEGRSPADIKLLVEAVFRQAHDKTAELNKTIEELSSRRVPDPDLVIALDSKGYPLSWEEIRTHVSALTKLLPKEMMSLHMQVYSPPLVSSDEREDEADALAKWYRSNKRLDAPGGSSSGKARKPRSTGNE